MADHFARTKVHAELRRAIAEGLHKQNKSGALSVKEVIRHIRAKHPSLTIPDEILSDRIARAALEKHCTIQFDSRPPKE